MESSDINIKELIKDNRVFFHSYRAGYLYYKLHYNGEVFVFPVPTEDIGEATFWAEDKAIYFMRYIRKALNNGEMIKENTTNEN